VFPSVELKADSKAAGQWATNAGGEYYAVGVGGALAGRGANLVVIDDPFSEQVVMAGNTDVFEDAYSWFQTGPLQRLAPDGACIIIHTRWNRGDLIGRLISQMANNPDADEWDVVEFPAILGADTEHPKSLWPERWPIEALLQKKANMAPQFWQAQYMQAPTSEAGALVKREWWQKWEKEDPPDCEYIIATIDAAQEAHNRADFNAFQVWGVFYDDREVANIILLDAWKKRMEYPELKKAMMREYERWEPDSFVIEKKSSGSVLYQEMRAAGVPVSEFTPGKGNDKIARVNSVSDIFASGLVWAPLEKRWALEVVEECADFPNGDHDDQVDAMTLALRRFRTGGFIRLPSDEKDEESTFRRKKQYY
jgi:predicted phage terminase large subunit-like protein